MLRRGAYARRLHAARVCVCVRGCVRIARESGSYADWLGAAHDPAYVCARSDHSAVASLTAAAAAVRHPDIVPCKYIQG